MSDKMTVAAFSSALVVDDSRSILDYFNIILEGLGVLNVFTAINGHKALEILEHEKDIELILCDLNMPEMDGIEFMRHLSARGYRGKVIIISGEHKRVIDSTARLAEAHDLNIIGTLIKPVTMKQLRDILYSTEYPVPEGITTALCEFSIDDLCQALDNDEFILYIQPKIDLRNNEVVGGEVLARWQHPQLGLIGAEAFIGFLEDNRLIDRLTDNLLDRALRIASRVCRPEPGFKISFNMSIDSLEHFDLPDRLLQRCLELGVSPQNLLFEITESRLVRDYKKVLEIMTRLRLKGFGLSIDDFGTGYSSMQHLQNFPFNELKIDKTFVTGASESDAARAIIESSVALARKLDMRVVAEGVETYEDWQTVVELGCDVIQGYMLARPMPPEEFVEFVRDKHYQTRLKLPSVS